MSAAHDPGTSTVCPSVMASGIYLVTWALLDYIGFIFEVAPGISPWYPPHGLSLAFLLQFGLRFWPLLWVGPMINGSLIWLRGEPLALSLLSLCIVGSYGGAAYALRRLGFDTNFTTPRDTLIFLAIGTLASAVAAASGMLVFAGMGLIEWAQFGEQTLNFAAGDTLGVVVLGPILLVWAMPQLHRVLHGQTGTRITLWSDRHPALSPWVFTGQMATCVAAICVAPFTWDLFSSPLLYVLFAPLIWITLTHSMTGVTVGVAAINIGLVWFIRLSAAPIALADLQLFMVAVSGIGLFVANIAQLMRHQSVVLQRTNDELRRLNQDLGDFIVVCK